MVLWFGHCEIMCKAKNHINKLQEGTNLHTHLDSSTTHLLENTYFYIYKDATTVYSESYFPFSAYSKFSKSYYYLYFYEFYLFLHG